MTIRVEKRDIVFILFALFITAVFVFFPRTSTDQTTTNVDLSEPTVVTTMLP